MSRSKFIDFVRLRNLTKKSRQRIAIGYFVVFWGLPFFTLIPQEITRISLSNWYLLVVVPVCMLILGYAIGTEYGFCPSLIFLIGILVFPSAFIFGFRPAWQYCIFFALMFGSGNFVTEVHKSTKEKKKIGG